MNRLILTLALAAALPVTQASVAAPDLSKVNGSLTAEAGRTYGDIDTVNGSITLEDKAVARNVETVNGSITLDSFARALDVSTVNGKILLRNGAAARSVETVNGSIVGVSNLRVEKTVEAVNGSIELGAHSVIGGNVETVNGNIKLLSMKVTGNVETVNGNITVGEDSVVTGHLKVSKPTGWGINWGKPKVPRIILGPNSQVLGGLIFEREVELYVHATAKYGKITYLEAEAGKAEALKPVVFTGKQPDIK
jgi:DUF4097 and DUF4098 domain-containing protein YvlB